MSSFIVRDGAGEGPDSVNSSRTGSIWESSKLQVIVYSVHRHSKTKPR